MTVDALGKNHIACTFLVLFFFSLYKILGVCLPDDPEGNAKLMLSILDCLPRANRVSLFS